MGDGGRITTILVVDDDPDILSVLQQALEECGYAVETAISGYEAIVTARAHLPDLILLDIMLPGTISGYEVCTHLRSMVPTHTIPIIFVSALGDTKSRIQGLEKGADDYITKPFDLAELEARVAAVLRRTQAMRVQTTTKTVLLTHQSTETTITPAPPSGAPPADEPSS